MYSEPYNLKIIFCVEAKKGQLQLRKIFLDMFLGNKINHSIFLNKNDKFFMRLKFFPLLSFVLITNNNY